MKTFIQNIPLATEDPIQLLDVTEEVRRVLRASGGRDGILTVISRHTTAFVNLNEVEPNLQEDMRVWLESFVPRDRDYLHNRNTVDDRDNAHSHLMGLLLNASETIPVVDGELSLGTWQSILFVEVDGPRPRRELTVHVMGS